VRRERRRKKEGEGGGRERGKQKTEKGSVDCRMKEIQKDAGKTGCNGKGKKDKEREQRKPE
jgi:hypothetical protein